MIVQATVFKPYCPLTLFQACGAGSTVFYGKDSAHPCLGFSLSYLSAPWIFLLPCYSLNCFLEDHLWSLKCYRFSWANPIWPFGLTHIFALPLWRCFPPLGWVTLLLLPIPLQSGHAIIISRSFFCSPSQKGLIPKLQPAPSSSPLPQGRSHVAAWALFLPHSFLFWIYIYTPPLFDFLIFIYFLAIPLIMQDLSSQDWTHTPAVDLNHWNLTTGLPGEVPFPTHHHPVCF